MATWADILASSFLVVCCLILVTISVYRLISAEGRASVFDLMSSGGLAGGASFVAVHHATKLARVFELILVPVPLPTFAWPALVFGGTLLVIRAHRTGISTAYLVDSTRPHRRALGLTVAAALVVWVGAWLDDQPTPWDPRAVIFHETRVLPLKVGERMRWEFRATIRRQCAADVRMALYQPDRTAPIWERKVTRGGAEVQPDTRFPVLETEEPLRYMDPTHPSFGELLPAGTYRLTFYRSQRCGSSVYAYEPWSENVVISE